MIRVSPPYTRQDGIVDYTINARASPDDTIFDGRESFVSYLRFTHDRTLHPAMTYVCDFSYSCVRVYPRPYVRKDALSPDVLAHLIPLFRNRIPVLEIPPRLPPGFVRRTRRDGPFHILSYEPKLIARREARRERFLAEQAVSAEVPPSDMAGLYIRLKDAFTASLPRSLQYSPRWEVSTHVKRGGWGRPSVTALQVASSCRAACIDILSISRKLRVKPAMCPYLLESLEELTPRLPSLSSEYPEFAACVKQLLRSQRRLQRLHEAQCNIHSKGT